MERKSKVSDRFPAPDVFFGTSADLARIVEIDLTRIVPNPNQPRRSFDEVKLQELADSIAKRGLIHPITVRKVDEGYMIVAGERRFRAFGLIDRSAIPAIIIEDDAGDEIALIENIQRENLSPVDEFEAVARLIEKHGYSQGEAAKALGKSRVSVNELMTLGTLATVILEEARIAMVSKSALIEIARAGDEAAQLALWTATKGNGGTVRAARSAKEPKPIAAITAVRRAGQRLGNAVAELPDEERYFSIKGAAATLLALINETIT